MKRDLDLVRKILLMSEDAPGRIDEVKLAALDDDADKLAFHVQLMAEHGQEWRHRWGGSGVP